MKTIILRIGDKKNGPPAVYPVKLLQLEWETGTWKEHQLASHDCPASLADGSAQPGVEASGETRHVGANQAAAAVASDEDSYGKALYNFVFQGGVGDKWKELTAEERCLVLEVAAPELRYHHWERMTGGKLDTPACEPKSSLVRGPLKLNLPPVFRDRALKVLVVVGSAEDDPNVHAQEELEELQATFTLLRHSLEDDVRDSLEEYDVRYSLEYDILKRPARDTLKAKILRFQPDIFHFIGHGDLDNKSQPFLYLFQPDSGTNLRWTLDDMIKDFGGHHPAFVFLNACYTVVATPREGAFSMADLFIDKLQARALLGMHAAIRGQTAGRLAGSLYVALVEGKRLDLALTDARCAADILKKNDPNRQWDWALPYLRLGVLPEQVLPIRLVPPPYLDIIDRTPCFGDNPYFVNRYAEHNEFLDLVQVDPGRASRLLLVKGAGKIGKSQLIRHCLEAVVRRGRLVKYVELDPERSYGLFDVIQLICEGDPDSLIAGPLPAVARGPLYRTLNALINRRDPREQNVLDQYSPDRVQPHPLDRLRWQQLPSTGGVEEQVPIALNAFLEALRAVSSAARKERADKLEEAGLHDLASQTRSDNRPFLLVLDQMAKGTNRRTPGILARVFSDFLGQAFVRPFAHGHIKDMILVLGITQVHVEFFGLDDNLLGTTPPSVEVNPLGAEHFRALAQEYAQRRSHGQPAPSDWDRQVEVTAHHYQGCKCSWSPHVLPMLFSIYYPSNGSAPLS
jgi:hypothetical protein